MQSPASGGGLAGGGGGGGGVPHVSDKDLGRKFFTTICDALRVARDGDEIHVYAKNDLQPYRERVVIDKSVVVKGCVRTVKEEEEELEKERRERKKKEKATKTRDKLKVMKMKEKEKIEEEGGEDDEKGEDRHQDGERERNYNEDEDEDKAKSSPTPRSGKSLLASGSPLRTKLKASMVVSGMVQSLKTEAAEDRAAEKVKELSDMYRSQGKKVEHKSVVIEFNDDEGEEPVVR